MQRGAEEIGWTLIVYLIPGAGLKKVPELAETRRQGNVIQGVEKKKEKIKNKKGKVTHQQCSYNTDFPPTQSHLTKRMSLSLWELLSQKTFCRNTHSSSLPFNYNWSNSVEALISAALRTKLAYKIAGTS